jgi:protein required for attachment to host cells
MKPRRKRSSLGPARPDLVVRALKDRRKRTLIVVADGARARFFSPTEDAATLRPARRADMVSAESRYRSRDLRSDRPGRGFSTARDARRAAFEPPHDYHKLEKHRFSVELARVLEDACEHNEFDQLVLVAPHRSLGELRKLLPEKVQEMVRREIPKDLTNETVPQLWRRLSPIVKPTL